MEIESQIRQDPGGDPFFLLDQANEQVLGADDGMAQVGGGFGGELQGAFRPGREGRRSRELRRCRIHGDELFDFFANVTRVAGHQDEDLGGHASSLLKDRQEDVLRVDGVAVEALGLAPGKAHDRPGSLGESLEHGLPS